MFYGSGCLSVASLDLRGLTALQCLSLGCDHQMDLWLPPKMQRLEITLHPRLFDNNRWTVGHGWGADAAEVVHSYTDSDLEWVLRAPMSWGEATITGVECEDDPGAALQLGRPTWARMLRGLTQLGTLIVQGKPSRLEPDQEGAYPNQLMGLLDFEREWPTGLTLKNLHAKSAFVPFDLAVRDAELLQFSEAVVLLTQARSAGELLDFLLRGRARAVRFRARFRKGLRTRFTFVGPGLGPQGLTPLDLAASAKSLAYVLDVAVSELCGGARGDGCCMEFRLVARRKEE